MLPPPCIFLYAVMYWCSCSPEAHNHVHFLYFLFSLHFLGASLPSAEEAVCNIFSWLRQTLHFCWAFSASLLPIFLTVFCLFSFPTLFLLLECLLFQLGLEFLSKNYFPWFEIPFLLLWLKEVWSYCIIYESCDKFCMYICIALNINIPSTCIW